MHLLHAPLCFPPPSIVTCALTMKYYVEENVAQRSCTTIRHVVKMLGTMSETLIFFFLGVATITTDHEWNWGYILFTLLFAFVWRALGACLSLHLKELANATHCKCYLVLMLAHTNSIHPSIPLSIPPSLCPSILQPVIQYVAIVTPKLLLLSLSCRRFCAHSDH